VSLELPKTTVKGTSTTVVMGEGERTGYKKKARKIGTGGRKEVQGELNKKPGGEVCGNGFLGSTGNK